MVVGSGAHPSLSVPDPSTSNRAKSPVPDTTNDVNTTGPVQVINNRCLVVGSGANPSLSIPDPSSSSRARSPVPDTTNNNVCFYAWL